jgi:hypothetical protein
MTALATANLVGRLHSRGVSLRLDRGRLSYRGPRPAITPDLLAEMRTHKAQLFAMVRGADVVAGDPSTWPRAVQAQWRKLAERAAEGLGLGWQEAEAVARARVVMGWAPCPPIAVCQRPDGSWPRVELPCDVIWIPRPELASAEAAPLEG